MSGAFGGSSGSASSRGTSTPVNFQLPNYTDLSGGVAGGLNNFFGLGPNGISSPTGPLSPFQVGSGLSSNTDNPLVAQVTPEQQNTLNELGAFGGGLSNTLRPAYTAIRNFLNPNFARNLATSPQTNAAVESALSPIRQSFRGQTIPGLVGNSTQSGQRVQGASGMGSSAFDQAFSTAQGNELATEASTAGSIVNNAYQTGLNIQANAPSMMANLSSTQVSDLVSTLNAQVLPQLTKQYGITAGLQLYQSNLSMLLQALGLGGQISQPAIAYRGTSSSNQSTETSPNIIGTLLAPLGGGGGGASSVLKAFGG